MGYFERSDLPYYYALSDGFTVGDANHQSTYRQHSTQAAPRGLLHGEALHAGRSTRVAPRGLLHGEALHAVGGRRYFLMLTCAQY